MKFKVLLSLFVLFCLHANAQTISIVGTGVNGWPPNQIGAEITLTTTDNISYTIENVLISDGEVKFRQDFDWALNWGGNTFPNGQGILNSSSDAIPTKAGIYDVTFNRINATYTFIGTPFPAIGIWGPAVDSQNGYVGNDIKMQTTDGVIYTLADFYFSSGQAYFRQDNNSTLVFGSVSFPTGTAQPSGPSIAVTGGEWFVTFNRNTGEYSFAYPSIGILGSALGGFGVEDTDLATTDGFNYSIKNLLTINGELKFRKNNSWSTNWGSLSFPSGTGTQDGKNIPVPGGVYNVTFERTSGNYQFVNSLSTTSYSIQNIKVYPNPSSNEWNFSHDNILDTISLFDFSGKLLEVVIPSSKQFSLKNNSLSKGVYFAKINSGLDFSIVKLVNI